MHCICDTKSVTESCPFAVRSLWQRWFQILNFSSCGRVMEVLVVTAVFWLFLTEER